MGQEADLEAKCFKLVKKAGGKLKKLGADNDRGCPDRLVILEGGASFFCEFKKPGCVPTKIQLYRLEELRTLGFVAEWVDSEARFLEIWESVIAGHRK